MFNVIGRGKLQQLHLISGSQSNSRIILPLVAVVFFAASSVWSQPKNVVVPRPELTKLALKSFTFTPASVTNGLDAIGRVILTGPVAANTSVSLKQLNTGQPFFAFESPVVVQAGRDNAPVFITTVMVTAETTSSVSASYGGVTKIATLTVLPTRIKSLTLNPNHLVGGGPVSAVMQLTGFSVGPGFQLSSSKPSLAWMDSMVKDSDFKLTVSVKTAAVTTRQIVNITVTLFGSTKQATLTLDPPY